MGKTYKDFKYKEDFQARRKKFEDRKKARKLKKQIRQMEKENGKG